jgi:hypothetical protein
MFSSKNLKAFGCMGEGLDGSNSKPPTPALFLIVPEAVLGEKWS